MKVCTYDNTVTMMRECWKDGEMVYAVALELLEDGTKTQLKHIGANIGPWKSGQHVGDLAALHKHRS
ncbi:MAG TPA: hypothetical protein VFM33_12855 [Aquabacterium sp.]|nr:hypothetical protein [Aquabacterium sp.]